MKEMRAMRFQDFSCNNEFSKMIMRKNGQKNKHDSLIAEEFPSFHQI